jgi:hypothetical protein
MHELFSCFHALSFWWDHYTPFPLPLQPLLFSPMEKNALANMALMRYYVQKHASNYELSA